MDGRALGTATAELMEKIERTYGDEAEIRDAVVVAEIGHKDDEGNECSAIEWYCTSARSVVREGLIAVASKASPFEASADHPEDEED